MKDIIYREDAIDKLNEWESECVWDSWTLKYKDDPKEHIVAPTDVVKNLPSAEKTGERELLKDGTLMLSTDLDITDVRRIILQKKRTHFCSVFYLE